MARAEYAKVVNGEFEISGRGVNNEILVDDIDTEYVLSWFDKKIIKNDKSCVAYLVKEAIRDSYKRLIFPSVEREVRSELKELAEEGAIDVFGKNLEK